MHVQYDNDKCNLEVCQLGPPREIFSPFRENFAGVLSKMCKGDGLFSLIYGLGSEAQ